MNPSLKRSVTVRRLEQADWPLWETFLAGREGVNIFHSPFVHAIFEGVNNVEVTSLGAFSGDGLTALGVGVLVPARAPLPLRWRSRLILYASPLGLETADGVEGTRLLVEEFEKLGKRTALFTEIRNSHQFPSDPAAPFMQKWEYIPYQNYLIRLDVGSDALWPIVSKRVRFRVQKGIRMNVTVRELSGDQAMQTYTLIENLYKSKKIPVLPRRIFENVVTKLQPIGHARIVAAEHEGRVIATRWALLYGGTVYDWYAASDLAGAKMHPNEILAWDVIKWGADHGYRLFDFGGGAVRGKHYGPATFKEKFRGELVEYGRWRVSSMPTLYRFLSAAYDVLQKDSSGKPAGTERAGENEPAAGQDASKGEE